jgi:type II secretory pathway pseudopilin PulG
VTLIEIIITLSIMGIVIAPLMSMFVTSQKINNEGEKKYNAIRLAQKYIEEIKSMDVFDTGASGYTLKVGSTDTYEKTVSEDGYTVDITVKKNDSVTMTSISETSIPEDGEFDAIYSIVTTPYEIDITKDDAKIKAEISINNASIVVNSSYSGTKLYVLKSDDSFDYTVSGNCTVIEIDEDVEKPENLLYDLTVEVYKDSDLLDTIKGSKIFKYGQI